jgi:hypothetical protein
MEERGEESRAKLGKLGNSGKFRILPFSFSGIEI